MELFCYLIFMGSKTFSICVFIFNICYVPARSIFFCIETALRNLWFCSLRQNLYYPDNPISAIVIDVARQSNSSFLATRLDLLHQGCNRRVYIFGWFLNLRITDCIPWFPLLIVVTFWKVLLVFNHVNVRSQISL